jgi:uncharacterized protein (DUF2062 family)
MRKYYRFARRKATRENLKKFFFDVKESPFKKALGVFIGVFIGVTPTWGLQVLSAIASAQFFKASKSFAAVSSYINITPLFPLIAYFSIKIGSLLLGNTGSLPVLSDMSIAVAKTYFWFYAVGCIPVAIITALFFASITYVSALYLNSHISQVIKIK